MLGLAENPGRVENQLKTIKLTTRKLEKERVAIVYLGMNERCSDSFSCNGIESTSDTTKVTNSHKARFRHRRNMIRHGERRVEYDTKVTSRVRRSNKDLQSAEIDVETARRKAEIVITAIEGLCSDP